MRRPSIMRRYKRLTSSKPGHPHKLREGDERLSKAALGPLQSSPLTSSRTAIAPMQKDRQGSASSRRARPALQAAEHQ